MLNETRVACFLSLAKTLNFHQTAKDLFMTQQSVSQHIAALEKRIGFPLFIRTNRFVALTQAGRKCYEFFSEYADRFNSLCEECMQLTVSSCPSLKVGYQGWTFLGSAANNAVDSMLKLHPNLELEIERHSPALLNHKLKTGDLPVTVQCGRWVHKGKNIRTGKLRPLSIVLLASPNHPAAVDGATYQDFGNVPLIIDTFEGESVSDATRRGERELKRLGLPPAQIILAPDREAAHTMAELRLGVLAATEIDRITQSNRFKSYPTAASDSLVCAWRTDLDNDLLLLFIRCLQTEYRAARNK